MYRDPGEDPISFGDIFEGEHLIDVYAKRESRPLGGGDMPRTAAERISRAVNRPLTEAGETIAMYTPALPQLAENFHALAFGGERIKRRGEDPPPLRAVLISDSCAVDTALGDARDRRPQGRLQFAPIVPATEAQITKLEERPLFGRFPLPGAVAEMDGEQVEVFEGGIAELRHGFMVDARDVRPDDRVLTLVDVAAEELEAAWDACALRRGPFAVADSVAKLARALAGEGGDAIEHESEVEMIAETLQSAWRLEGRLLRRAADSAHLDIATIEQIVAEFRELEALARAAHERLSRVLSQDQ